MDAARHFIIGTAGHIDHGKTALVKALTGINTDRLKEEQERGMTIDLGYAFLDVAGQRVGIVDVPGHEKFVKNMLAGATGIDLALLVIAADDGVMPQTVEHLEILDLLGVRHGIVAITKIDLVQADLRAIVREETANLLSGTTLEGSEVLEVSSVTGEGIEALKQRIGTMISSTPSARPMALPFRMPIDRVFTEQGFGCVVTGSVMTGAAAKGQTLEILGPSTLPGGCEVRVRGIQVHGVDAERAMAGQRTALNLTGVKAGGVARGSVLSEPGHMAASDLVDAELRLLKTARQALKHNARVRLHVGTSEVMARVSVLEGNELKPGASGFIQLKLEQPVAVQRGDRYVVRSYSPMRTIGGGRILRRSARRLKRNRKEAVAALGRLSSDDAKTVIEQAIRDAPPFTTTAASLSHVVEIAREPASAALSALVADGRIVVERGASPDRGKLAHVDQLAEVERRVIDALTRYHAAHRLDVGMVPAQLLSRVRIDMPQEVFAQILTNMKDDGAIKEVGGLVALSGFAPRPSSEERAVAEKLNAIFESAGFSPPLLRDALEQAGGAASRADQVLKMLIDSGAIVRITEDLCFHASALDRIKQQVVAFLREKGQANIGELKDLLGLSRKFAIPIAEHLDRIGVTRRVGDARVLKT